MGGDIPVHMRYNTLGQVIGHNFIINGQFLELGYQAPVPSDHPFYQTFMPQMVQAPFSAVSLTSRIEQGQILRLPVV